MKLDGRQLSRIVGKLIEASIKNDEGSLKHHFLYYYHKLTIDNVIHHHDDQ